jgi:hypothetical protein
MRRERRSKYVLLVPPLFALLKPEQITRKIKRTLQKSLVEHAVAERKTWDKFGLEKGKKPGPDGATTTVGEMVFLKITPGNKVRGDYHDLYQFFDACASSQQN